MKTIVSVSLMLLNLGCTSVSNIHSQEDWNKAYGVFTEKSFDEHFCRELNPTSEVYLPCLDK